MPAGYRSRSQYLSLARFCQDLIASLFEYLDGHSGRALRRQLTDALRSLEVVKTGNLYQFGQKRLAAFGTYEQLQTLAVWSDTEVDDAVRLLRRLLEDHPNDRDQDARELIGLFSRLRAKALWNFEQSPPAVTIVAREAAPAR